MTTIDRLRELERKATKPPWRSIGPIEGGGLILQPDSTDADSELIVALRNAAPALLAVVEQAEKVLTAAELYEAEAKELGVWSNKSPDGIIVAGIVTHLRPALSELERLA